MDILIFSLSHCGSAAPGLGAHGTVITNQPGTAGQPVGPPQPVGGTAGGTWGQRGPSIGTFGKRNPMGKRSSGLRKAFAIRDRAQSRGGEAQTTKKTSTHGGIMREIHGMRDVQVPVPTGLFDIWGSGAGERLCRRPGVRTWFDAPRTGLSSGPVSPVIGPLKRPRRYTGSFFQPSIVLVCGDAGFLGSGARGVTGCCCERWRTLFSS